MSIYKIIDASVVSKQLWQDYVDEHVQGNVFFTPFMYEVYNCTPNFEPFALFAIDDKGDIQAMLSGYIQVVRPGVLSWISKRSVIMQSPIYSEAEALKHLLYHYKQMMNRKVIYTEIRNNFDTKQDKSIYDILGFRFEDHLNIIIDLSKSEAEIWKQIHSKRRNEIRKSIKENVSVTPLGSDSMREVYGILQEVYNRAQLPLLPFTFFKQANDMSNEKVALISYGAFCNDKLIGTMVTLQYKRIVYDLFAGSLSTYYNKNPNDLIPWAVFQLSKEQGYEMFDFGGAGKPSVPYGVRDYKLKFGGETVNYGRYSFIHSPIKYRIADLGFQVMRKMRVLK